MTNVFIFDIDQTLADNRHREHLLQHHCTVCAGGKDVSSPYCDTCGQVTDSTIPQKCWDQFCNPELFLLDTPYSGAQKFLSTIRGVGSNQIFYITGRKENGREATEAWLTMHMGRVASEDLVMRPNGAFNKSAHERASTYKEKALLDLIDKRGLQGNNFFFFEDDDYVLPMYNKYGVTFKCPEVWNYLMYPGANRAVEPLINR